jgi:hypothetical protein
MKIQASFYAAFVSTLNLSVCVVGVGQWVKSAPQFGRDFQGARDANVTGLVEGVGRLGLGLRHSVGPPERSFHRARCRTAARRAFTPAWHR